MRNYGGSVLAYCACFGMKEAVRRMVQIDLVDVDSNPCPITGYLPIHAVVACELAPMYDFLVNEIRCNPSLETTPTGSDAALPLGPLQLAVSAAHRAVPLPRPSCAHTDGEMSGCHR